MTHLNASPTETTARLLTEVEENKLVKDLDKLLNKYSREISIDSLASVVGKLVQDQYGQHNVPRFVTKFKEAVERAQINEETSNL